MRRLLLLVVLLAAATPLAAQTVAQGAPGARPWLVASPSVLTSTTFVANGTFDIDVRGISSISIYGPQTVAFTGNIAFLGSNDNLATTFVISALREDDHTEIFAITPSNTSRMVRVNTAALTHVRLTLTGFAGPPNIPITVYGDAGAANQQVSAVVVDAGNHLGIDGFGSAKVSIRNDGGSSVIGQGTMAQSVGVTMASDQTPLSVRTTPGNQVTVATVQLPGALVGGRLDANVGAWLGSTAPTVGQKTMVNSVPMTLASDQPSLAVKTNLGESVTVQNPVPANLQVRVEGSSASGAAKFGNPVQVSGVFNTTQPTVTNGQTVELQATARGAAIVAPGVEGFAVTAASLPLPAGAATAARQDTGNTSLASVDGKLPAALVGGRLDSNIGAWLGSTAPTVGQKTSANSVPVVLPSDGTLPLPTGAATSANQTSEIASLASIDAKLTSPITVTGTVTANAGTNLNTSALALDATLTNRTQLARLTDGVTDGTIKPASTAALADDTAYVVGLSPNSPLPAGTNSVGAVDLNTATLQILAQIANARVRLPLPQCNAVRRTSCQPKGY